MKDNKIQDEASMLGITTADSGRLIKLARDGKIPAKAWLTNYRKANTAQRDTIISVLRETA